MSNKLYIVPTAFTNLHTGEVSYGVRIHDDYISHYDNTWEYVPDDDLEVLQKVVEENCNEEVGGLLDALMETETGVHIGEVWYDWDEIKDVFSELIETTEDEE